jgi:acyl-[acyl carrier protein]--UDP-N-acetylglucosamine O-acyltransferase
MIERVTGLSCTTRGAGFAALGLASADLNGTLTFLDDDRFVRQLIENRNITGAIIDERNVELVVRSRPDLIVFVSEDPRYDFYSLQNELTRMAHAARPPTLVDPTAVVHCSAYIASYGVVVGPDVQVHARATVLEDVEIGEASVIRSGAVVGAEGFEHKRTRRGILSVWHDGKVILGRRVEIGVNNAVAKGFAYRHTSVGDDTKTDSLVHIAHGVQIGKRCLLPAGCVIAGSVTIEDDVWIGPNATVSSQLTVGAGAYVSLGSVVTRDVPPGARVTGNFAIPHDQFMHSLKRKALSDEPR